MNTTPLMHRRRFLQLGGSGLAALAAANWIRAASVTGPESKSYFHGLKLGVASYSFRKFTLDQALAMTKELGLNYICLKDFHLDMKSTPEQLAAANKKVKAAGLTLMGGGVIYLENNEADIRRAFEYAKGAGMPAIVSSPAPEALDIVERMAKQYNIRVAIHNHGPGDKKYPLPIDAYKLIEKRDRLLGLCIDVGHTLRVGGDPIGDLRRYADRLYDVHLKDVSAAVANGEHVEFGTGVMDIPGVLKALLDIKFNGHVEMEYEATPDDPLPGMKRSVAYIQKCLAKIG